MLDRSLVIEALHMSAERLFVDKIETNEVARQAWKEICLDTTFLYKVRACLNAPWPVPDWSEKLDLIFPVNSMQDPYMVISIDGSQIYPDRHYGINCFLVNIGTVVIPYGLPCAPVQLHNKPYIFTPHEDWQLAASVTDYVNGKRQELEFIHTIETAFNEQKKYGLEQQLLCLFDGSLIFWHLSSQNSKLQQLFLDSYISSLDQLYQHKIPVAGYISFPKSKELVNLLRLFLCNFDVSQEDVYEVVNSMVDSSIVRFFLPEGHRTIVFKNQSAITAFYPVHLHPHFFYINTGEEIARIEVPAWIAQDIQLVDMITSQILDQCKKGGGYPIAIAEAHEQAVVKGPDRDFFYYVLDKMSLERNYKSVISTKSLRKKRIGF